MALIIILALILIPYIEISIFVSVGAEIGALSVVGLSVATAAAGIALVRAQGLETLQSAQRELERKRAPLAEMLNGAMLVLAGLFLLIPGFLTDAVGAVFLIPPARRLVARLILRHTQPGAGDVVIDGEYWEYSTDGERKKADEQQKTTVIEGEVIDVRDGRKRNDS